MVQAIDALAQRHRRLSVDVAARRHEAMSVEGGANLDVKLTTCTKCPFTAHIKRFLQVYSRFSDFEEKKKEIDIKN